MKLLSRTDFRNGVFNRDDHKCVICSSPAKDAHHIMERRLFKDSGYYLENGSSLCNVCHISAEKTNISTQVLRDKCGIIELCLPEHLYGDYVYDKWGNIELPNGGRIKGELFDDVSVQKILSDHLDIFIPYIKYPRTYHVPWTESSTTDDKILSNMDQFIGMEVFVTVKMDGENSSIYSDGYFHARSIDGNSHPSQSWLKSNKQNWFYDIPKGWRVCGENLYATHSIEYDDLDNYFEVFSIWDEKNNCLSLEDTLEWCDLLGLNFVPSLYVGVYDEDVIRVICENLDTDVVEGCVIRNAGEFHYSKFRHNIAKFVRADHVQDVVHNWRMNWDSNNINHMRK